MKIQLNPWHRLAGLVIVGLLVIGVGTQIKPSKVFRVGFLNPDPPLEPLFDGFKAEMLSLGYTEGQTIEYVYEGATGTEPGKLESAASALVSANVDMILSITGPASAIARDAVAGTEIPVLFWMMGNPVDDGLVTTMQVPGGNLTGMTIGIEGIASEGRRLEWLTHMVPGLERVFIPYNPNHPPVVEQALPTIQEAADSLGIELVLQPVLTPEEAEASAQAIPDGVDAIYIIHLDRMVTSRMPAFIESAIQHNLPLSVLDSRFVRDGALMSFGIQYPHIGEQAAHMADQLLEGAQAAEMPVEIPEFYLSVNLQTADAIGLEIPDSMIRQADVVVR